jgi:uncharacterized protein YutE (UPF0331/DUF86 family)
LPGDAGRERQLALCYHVSARQLRSVPEDYAGCFAGLAKAGLIPADPSTRLPLMARFRNLLVHVYWEVDYGRVFDVIEHDLEDLRSFSERGREPALSRCPLAARR